MDSKLLLKDIQALLLNEVEFSKTSLPYVHHMVGWSSSSEEIVVNKLKKKIDKIHYGINRELIHLALDKLRAKDIRKHSFTIQEVYQELLDLLFATKKSISIIVEKQKEKLDRGFSKLINDPILNKSLIEYDPVPIDKLQQNLFSTIQTRSING